MRREYNLNHSETQVERLQDVDGKPHLPNTLPPLMRLALDVETLVIIAEGCSTPFWRLRLTLGNLALGVRLNRTTSFMLNHTKRKKIEIRNNCDYLCIESIFIHREHYDFLGN